MEANESIFPGSSDVPTNNFETKDTSAPSKISLPQELLDEVTKLRRHLTSCLNADAHIDFGVLFSAKNKHTRESYLG